MTVKINISRWKHRKDFSFDIFYIYIKVAEASPHNLLRSKMSVDMWIYETEQHFKFKYFSPFYYYHLKHTTQSKVVKKKARQAMFKSLFVVPSFILV